MQGRQRKEKKSTNEREGRGQCKGSHKGHEGDERRWVHHGCGESQAGEFWESMQSEQTYREACSFLSVPGWRFPAADKSHMLALFGLDTIIFQPLSADPKCTRSSVRNQVGRVARLFAQTDY